MSDPIWEKVAQLTKGYPPEFDAGAVYLLVQNAWRMGFDVFPLPEDRKGQYIEAMLKISQQLQNATELPNPAGFANRTRG